MTFRDEFPDYDPAKMPTMPEGFEDCSWHNDTMPHFWNKDMRLDIWVDHDEPAARDFIAADRFQVYATNEDGEFIGDEPIFQANDWDHVLRFIEVRRTK